MIDSDIGKVEAWPMPIMMHATPVNEGFWNEADKTKKPASVSVLADAAHQARLLKRAIAVESSNPAGIPIAVASPR